MELWSIENSVLDEGFSVLCGVDEAGRGPLAGPVYAAAVRLPRGLEIEGLDDSKKLSEKKREALFPVICASALDYSIAWASEGEIDELNILRATFLAMNRAMAGLKTPPDMALVDGNTVAGIKYPARPIIGGDGKCASIAAASILAKVSRDRYMYKMAELYPEYGFDRHKGYGTALHVERLKECGPSPIHRLTFLKKLKGEVPGL